MNDVEIEVTYFQLDSTNIHTYTHTQTNHEQNA